MSRELGPATIRVGVLLELAGFIADSALHTRDATLAAREGVFMLANPGHLLLASGLALTTVGICVTLLAPQLYRVNAVVFDLTDSSRWFRRLVPVVLFATTVFAFSSGALSVAARNSNSGHQSNDSRSEPHADAINLSWEQLREIDHTLTTAKEATEKYRDVSMAVADGYVRLSQFEPLHFFHPHLLQSPIFEATRPAIRIYDKGADGGVELIGVGWTSPRQPGDTALPPSPFAPLAMWHHHNYSGICIIRTRQAGSYGFTPGQCDAAGGVFIGEFPWVLHAWLVRPSPEGLFSHMNSAIRGADVFD